MTAIQIPEIFSPLFQPARYKAFYGGRGGAKSHAFATALLALGMQSPLRVLCCREIQDSIKDSVKRLLDDKINAYPQFAGYDSNKMEISHPNGTLFLFAGMWANIQSIKSMEGIDIAWVEEASSASQDSLDTLIPTLRKPGSELWFSWNPDLENDPVDVMFRGEYPPPNAVIQKVGYADNPWFPDVLREEMAWDLRRDPDKYAHIWLGEYRKNSEARVFKNWRVSAFDTPEDARFYFGADWGFSVDPTVLVRCFIDEEHRTLYVDNEIYRIGCEIDRTPALFDKVDGSRRWPIRADSARPETISYMQRQGFNIQAARKGAGSVEEGIEFLKNYDIVVHPRCKHTADELALYSYKVDRKTKDVLPILEDKENHVVDALRYAVEGIRRGKKPGSNILPFILHTPMVASRY